MIIRRKLNLIICSVLVAVFAGIAAFVFIYMPVVRMQFEKKVLRELDISVLEMRGDVNKLPLTYFREQIYFIEEENIDLTSNFKKISGLTYLKKDPEMNKSLNIVANLYIIYVNSYGRFKSTIKSTEAHLQKALPIDGITLYEVETSNLFDDYENRADVTYELSNLRSLIAVMDSNLTTTHNVVTQQFEIIDNMIVAKERKSYILGIAIVFFIGIAALIVAFFITSKISLSVKNAADGIERMSTGDVSKDFEIQSKDEIGDLEKDLNILSQSLRASMLSLKSSSSRGCELKEELITSANETSVFSAEIAENSQEITKKFETLKEKVDDTRTLNRRMKKNLYELEGCVSEQYTMLDESTTAVSMMIDSINSVNEITTQKKETTITLVETAVSGGDKLK
ncbi:MAG: HAMP domain-containing protein, partial [Spirochaetales bacterium]|nr:HAMP domain-containing protein [Spirochaetales bacterium]